MHLINLPRRIVIGPNVLRSLGDLCLELCPTGKLMVVTGDRTLEVAGREALNSLSSSRLDYDLVVVEEPNVSVVETLSSRARETHLSAFIGVGGGSIIDVAKLAAYRAGAGFISVPTSASHDGIASPRASVKGLGVYESVPAQTPLAIVADTSIIMKAPRRLLVSGCGDVVAKLTAVRDWLLAHRLKGEYYGEYAASLARMSAQLVVKNVVEVANMNDEGVRVLLEALVSCGVAMCIAGSSRPCSGSEHQFSHALDIVASKPALHGEQCGVGTIMMAYLHGLDWRKIRAFLKKLGAPVNAEELSVSPSDVVKALTIAHKVRGRYTILGETGLTEGAAYRLAKVTGVIE
ncbi:MAG: NAD(P)-dependent glycerol-1-phosphate dehydrogenase [Candidatus Nezhaarchaeota archaeon]|nr:NAD(P)-dependent glycerol-1-phosphate dehydrogenase [Candidatus Nezhaarchaeota archaeon]